MPVGGKLTLKGGVSLKAKAAGVSKKPPSSKAKAKQPLEDGRGEETKPDESVPGITVAPASRFGDVKGNTYEDEFHYETTRRKIAQEKKGSMIRSTPWSSTYREAPDVLHGYKKKYTDEENTAELRLDLRCAQKRDKFCS